MDMTYIFDLVERSAFPYVYAKAEYRKNQHCALEHMKWLEEHLSGEEMEHLGKVQEADLCTDTLEREAIIRTALAVGIRLALPL